MCAVLRMWHSALMRTAVAELTVLVMLAAGCSSGNVARVSDACDLLTSSEVADNIHADADPGVLMSASNETETRICSFKVGGQLGAVLVYLGAGVAPATAQNDAAGAFERIRQADEPEACCVG